MWTVFLAIVIWSSIGLAISVLFRRQGHNFFLYAAIAIWLGPLIALVMGSVARQQGHADVRVLRSGGRSSGWLHVLVGVDRSLESVDSIRSVIAMLGPAVGRIRIVSALDEETANSPSFFSQDDELEHWLVSTAVGIGFPDAELAFVTGRADRALVEHATEGGFDVLVVAHRSHNLRAVLFGSTVERLSRHATVPLLIGPPAAAGGQSVPGVASATTDLSSPAYHLSNKPHAPTPPTNESPGHEMRSNKPPTNEPPRNKPSTKDTQATARPGDHNVLHR